MMTPAQQAERPQSGLKLKVVVVLLAAGSGQRFGGDKLAEVVGGKPVWQHSFETLLNHDLVDGIVVVTSPANYNAIREQVGETAEVILGGDTRTASTIAGMWKAAQVGATHIAFHDAARPFVSRTVITMVIEEALKGQAAGAALPVSDTIKRANDDLAVTDHLTRAGLYAMQTPQAAPIDFFVQAFSKDHHGATDDLEVLARAGFPTIVVPGDPNNFKITTPEDLLRAQSMMAETRTGLGYDIHRFSTDPGRPCWLGGVLFKGEIGLDGHSDADVILHAVVDALLGAIAGGDIGVLFPNDDPANKDRASSDFLHEAVKRVTSAGWALKHIDISVQAERPKIMPRAEEIRKTLANLLSLDMDRVSIKATTQEKLGALGRGEGIAAYAICTISR